MSILSEIVEYKKRLIPSLPECEEVMESECDFMAIFDQFSVIAECKARSPSEGKILEHYQPEKIAKEYLEGGANAVSVLTDQHYFGGSFEDLFVVKKTVELPTLCKDFILDERQIRLARYAGADACLLIMAILDDQEVRRLKEIIEKLNMVAVLEVHTRKELWRAKNLLPEVVLINNRNLNDFSVNFEHTQMLCEHVPPVVKVISASGINHPDDMQYLPARVDAVLVGTALMRAKDRIGFIKELKDDKD